MEAKEKGIKDVYLDLAYCYESGIEVERRSPTKAFELTKKAYEHGGLWASKHLAIYYEKRFGVEKNLDEAARKHHAPVAQAYYGHCLIRGMGVKQNVD